MHLAIHLHYLPLIRAEHRSASPDNNLSRPCPLLDAIINESMRLWPSIFFASQRVTPPSGLSINGHVIPGNIIVQIPPFALNRDPRNFIRPDEFIPERWTTRPELILNRAAFMPFSTGPYGCVGKGLALMELRCVVGRVVADFDVKLPEGFAEEKYWEGVRDHFTAGAPRQEVRFVRVGEL